LSNMATQGIERHELPNVGEGPDPYSLRDGFENAESVVLLLQRNHHCRICKIQTKKFAERYEEFTDRDAEVIVVLPDSRSKARGWAEDLNLPFALLADEEASLGDEYGQKVRFGVIGSLHDLVGRMPSALVLRQDNDGEVRVVYEHNGNTYTDRPSVDKLLAEVEAN